MLLDQYQIIEVRTAADEDCDTNILVIYTGGTIGMDYAADGKHLIPFDFQALLEKVPELMRFQFRLTLLVPFEPLDSSNMGIDHWLSLGWLIEEVYHQYDGFVVLHGTDTMAYSASALSFLLQNLDKPIIFTGAQIPISANRTDARENLISALEIASHKTGNSATVSEVCIFFDNLLLRGNRARKVQSLDFTAFESENYPHLAEAGIFINFNKNVFLERTTKPFVFHSAMENSVLNWKIFPSMKPHFFEKMLDCEGIKGVVLESFGSGNIPTESWLLKLLQKLVDRKILIFNVSQCAGGKVLQGHYETSQPLDDLGVVSGRDITPEAAITKMMHLLAMEKDYSLLQARLATPIAGEMSEN
ncbi:asparaginase [Hugenholtzia roseola]|uniref:asparaginase n=1 Tax=Hugenholtzia roseola TaxID=1002 RepID=UPI000411FC0C|nr:asparaginase [Hugenholtzia roseola]